MLFSKNATLRTEVIKQRERLQTRKKRITGKRVALKGKLVFGTQKVLEMAREAEKVTADKTARTQRRKRRTAVELDEQENQVV